ncbi:MAG: circularly permuted type 2 ATP-grasp protein [Acidimicrobiia bacterium]|nr:circularly permuted type 2 ATP-grasp protein [Acidimicrobiia bacterium]
MDRLLADIVDTGFSEVSSADGIRPHYLELMHRLESLGPENLSARAQLLDSIFQSLGITFAVYGHDQGVERTWPMDLVPRIIPADEWRPVEAGLVQRVTALNAFLDDLYVGEGAAIRDGIVPRWIIESADGYTRDAYGIEVPSGARCAIAGIDIVRDGDGVYRVLEDNLRVPSGISYVLENRVAMTRVLPVAFAQHAVRPVNHYGSSLLKALRASSPRASGDPTVAVLTPGVANSAYFEHAFLARQMGVELVEGRDLLVDEHVVYMRTTRGLQRVDVLYRRIGDEFLDPVVFRPDSLLGVPGIVSAARAGNVTIANAVGNGAADDKGVYPFVPDLIRFYLGQEPILPNVTTYLPWEPDQLPMILERLDQLVVKPVAEAGGYGIVVGSKATDSELAAVAANLKKNPRGYIAQETVSLSTHPTFIDGKLRPRHIDLRPFVLTGETVEVIPGGLTRVALREGSLIVNSSQGGGSKDTWVLAG